MDQKDKKHHENYELQGKNVEIQTKDDDDTCHGYSCGDLTKDTTNTIETLLDSPFDWKHVNLCRKTKLLDSLQMKFMKCIDTDVTVRMAQHAFYCHLIVLNTYSIFFQQYRNGDIVELPVEIIRPDVFQSIYDWMVWPDGSGKIILTRRSVLDVLKAAEYLRISELEDQCWKFLGNRYVFDEDVALAFAMKAMMMNNDQVMTMMIGRIRRSFLRLVGTDFYNLLPIDIIVQLLKSNSIAIHSEVEVFMSAVKWLMYDWEHRIEHAVNVMKCVRFALMPATQLVCLRRSTQLDEITTISEVRKMIERGRASVAIRCLYSDNPSAMQDRLKYLDIDFPDERKWIGKERKYFSYDEFVFDLETYKTGEYLYLVPTKHRTSSSSSSSSSSQTNLYDVVKDVTEEAKYDENIEKEVLESTEKEEMMTSTSASKVASDVGEANAVLPVVEVKSKATSHVPYVTDEGGMITDKPNDNKSATESVDEEYRPLEPERRVLCRREVDRRIHELLQELPLIQQEIKVQQQELRLKVREVPLETGRRHQRNESDKVSLVSEPEDNRFHCSNDEGMRITSTPTTDTRSLENQGREFNYKREQSTGIDQSEVSKGEENAEGQEKPLSPFTVSTEQQEDGSTHTPQLRTRQQRRLGFEIREIRDLLEEYKHDLPVDNQIMGLLIVLAFFLDDGLTPQHESRSDEEHDWILLSHET